MYYHSIRVQFKDPWPRRRTQVYLLFGKSGWLGGKLTALLKEQGKEVHLASSRLENRESVVK